MFKRTLSWLSLLMIFAVVLSACGSQATSPSANAPTAGGTTAPTTATDPPAAPAQTQAAPAGTQAAAPGGTQAAAGGGGNTTAVMNVMCGQQASWVRNFNPFVNDNRHPTIHGIHEPLMIYNTVKGELMPWLATAYEWSADNKKLTFTLRDNVKWSDGQPFTAKDVAFTFNYFKEQTGLQGPGGQAVTGDAAYVESVNAPNDTTVEFNFKQVFTPGLYDITNQVIVPEHKWKDVTDATKYTNDNPVGTGPFTEVRIFQNQVYEVGKNPNYWQEGKPMFDGIRCPALPSNDAVNLALVNGEIDWTGSFVPDIENVYVAKNPQNFGYWFPSVGATVMLYLNTTKKPFDDPNVRKAISQCINRDQIVEVAMYDYTKPADVTGLSEAYPNFKVADPATLADWTTYSVEKANQALDAAGLTQSGGTRTANGAPMTYEINVVSGWSDWVSAVQIIAQNLKQCGINATVKSYDFSAWFDRVQKGEFDISIGWSSGGATPYNYYRDQMSQRSFKPVGEAAGANWHRYVSKTADDLLNQFAGTSDPAQQKQLAEQLQRTFAEEAPAIPLFPGPQWYQYNTTRFEGFPTKDNPYSGGSNFNQGTPEQLLVMTTVKAK